jgi:hypothetical protein
MLPYLLTNVAHAQQELMVARLAHVLEHMLHGQRNDTRRGVVALHGVRLKTSKQVSKQRNQPTARMNETSQQRAGRQSLSACGIFCRMES